MIPSPRFKSSSDPLSSASYVGWIPNVGGRLSFSHIGQTIHPAACSILLNEADDAGRVVLCVQTRRLSDSLLPPWYLRFVYDVDPYWQFVLLGQTEAVGTDRFGALEGVVYIFTKTSWSNAAGRISPQSAIASFLNRIGDEDRSGTELVSGFRAERSNLAKQLEATAIYAVNCKIERSGQTELCFASIAANTRFSPAIGEPNRPLQADDKRYMSNQAFYFLKDISHSHRHHTARHDTITQAHPLDDEFSWLRDTQYSIHRRVVAKRRDQQPRSFYESLGLMAYMSSLTKLAGAIADKLPGEDKEKASGIKIATSYNLKETEDSIKASLEQRRWERVQWNIVCSALPALVIAIGALLKPTQAPAEPGTAFDLIRAWLSTLFRPDFWGFAVLIIVLGLLPWLYGAYDPTRSRVVTYFKRSIASMDQGTQENTLNYIALAFFIPAAGGAIGLFLTPGATLRNTIFVVVSLLFVALLALLFALPFAPTGGDLLKAVLRRLKGSGPSAKH